MHDIMTGALAQTLFTNTIISCGTMLNGILEKHEYEYYYGGDNNGV